MVAPAPGKKRHSDEKPRYLPPLIALAVVVAIALFVLIWGLTGDQTDPTGTLGGVAPLAPHPTGEAQLPPVLPDPGEPDPGMVETYARTTVDPRGPTTDKGLRVSVSVAGASLDAEDPTRFILAEPRPASDAGTIEITGTITNRTARACKTLTLRAYAFDVVPLLIGTGGGALRDVPAGASRPFALTVTGITPGRPIVAVRVLPGKILWAPAAPSDR